MLVECCLGVRVKSVLNKEPHGMNESVAHEGEMSAF